MRSTTNHAGRSRWRIAVLLMSLAVVLLSICASSSWAMSPLTLSSRATLVEPTGGAGFKFFDTATLSASGEQPTGTVTFKAFGPILWPFAYSSAACSGAPTYESTDPVVDASATSQTFVPPPGDEKLYLFTASYSGDTHYEPTTSECGAANESVLVPLVSFALPGVLAEAPPAAPPAMPSVGAAPVRVTSFSFSPSRFALGRGKSSLVRFSLSTATPIEIVFARKVSGQQTVRGCIPALRPAKVSKRRRCVARRVMGAVATVGKIGANEVVFDGHVGSRLLPAGTYVAQVRAAGVSSSTAGIELVRHRTESRH